MKYELPSTELIVIEENNYLKFGEYLNDMQCDDTTNKLCLDDLEYVKKLQQENKQLKENYERIYNENCKLREEHNITDISLLDENYKLKDNWNKLKKTAKSQSGFKKRADLKGGLWFEIDELLDKMQEMEKKYGNMENNT